MFNNNEEKLTYTTNIAWESDTFVVNTSGRTSIVGSEVYVFGEAAPDDSEKELLVKVNADTGEVIWKSESFPITYKCAPKVIGDHVYIFIGESLIYSFIAETGELSAIIETDIEDKGIKIESNAITHGNYLYFGTFMSPLENYLVRLDITDIDRAKSPAAPQYISPEIVWVPESGRPVWAEPVVKDNIIYCLTFVFYNDAPVELVGINMNTKAVVFHKWLDHDDGGGEKPLLINEDIIYILSRSISAYNLNTGEPVFIKTFTNDTPDEKWYSAASSLGQTYYEGKIYYTNGISRTASDTDKKRNTFCIDAKTGELLWSDIPSNSESLGTNPIIYNDKMYVPQGYGLRVYNAKNGKIIGTDTSFWGACIGNNLLYKNYMITVRYNENTGDGTLVAVNLGG
jgi:hypothetical protein